MRKQVTFLAISLFFLGCAVCRNFDGTGPDGLGPRTGRCLGYCANTQAYCDNTSTRTWGQCCSYSGRGCGWGRGWGQGCAFNENCQLPALIENLNPEERIKAFIGIKNRLESEIELMKKEMIELESKINELDKEKK